jgi:hypothetical protein
LTIKLLIVASKAQSLGNKAASINNINLPSGWSKENTNKVDIDSASDAARTIQREESKVARGRNPPGDAGILNCFNFFF